MFPKCRLIIKPGVYRHRSTIRFARIPYRHPSFVFYSSKSCDSGESDKKGLQSFGTGSDQITGKRGNDPCESCYCPCPPTKTPFDGEDNPSSPSMYDQRKYGHCLPKNNANLYFEPLPHIPSGIFRNTDDEILGLGASKACMYKNPEYFAYHHMSYYDMHLNMRCYRRPSPKTGRKP